MFLHFGGTARNAAKYVNISTHTVYGSFVDHRKRNRMLPDYYYHYHSIIIVHIYPVVTVGNTASSTWEQMGISNDHKAIALMSQSHYCNLECQGNHLFRVCNSKGQNYGQNTVISLTPGRGLRGMAPTS